VTVHVVTVHELRVTALLAEDPRGIKVASGAAVFDRRFHGGHSKSLGGVGHSAERPLAPGRKLGF
jgi:hypothetical protein